jgi:hypothetical protein
VLRVTGPPPTIRVNCRAKARGRESYRGVVPEGFARLLSGARFRATGGGCSGCAHMWCWFETTRTPHSGQWMLAPSTKIEHLAVIFGSEFER